MTDDFNSLKNLGKTISKNPPEALVQHWAHSSAKLKKSNSFVNRVNWWQLAAALLVGILIGKFVLQSNPRFLSTMAKNSSDDETFEYIYTNN